LDINVELAGRGNPKIGGRILRFYLSTFSGSHPRPVSQNKEKKTDMDPVLSFQLIKESINRECQPGDKYPESCIEFLDRVIVYCVARKAIFLAIKMSRERNTANNV